MSGRVLRRLALLTAVCGLLLGGTAAADLSELRPVDLQVDGEETWHPDNFFSLRWDPPPASAGPVEAVHYRLRDASWNIASPDVRLAVDHNFIVGMQVPPVPGRYTVEVWLESVNGTTGPAASATLRFDDLRPGPVTPVPVRDWVAGDGHATVRLEHPVPPLPVSGLRGYAVWVDEGAGDTSCLAVDRCTEAETDLRGGIGADTISLGYLPEGFHTVHAVAVSGSGMRSVQVGSATLRIDATLPQVSLHGAPSGWSDGPVRVVATATDALSGMNAAGPDGPFTAIAVDGRVPTAVPGDSAAAIVSGEGAHRVSFYAGDAAGNVADGSGGGVHPSEAPVRIDETAPKVGFSRYRDPAEPERIEALVSDSLSGPDPARGSIAVRRAGGRGQFSALPTTVSAGGLVARWDSDSFPSGTYEFRAVGFDAAGNSSASERRQDGARMVLQNPLKKPTALEAGFGGRQLVWQRCVSEHGLRRCHREVLRSFERRPKVRSLRFGHGLPFSGRLRSLYGTPLSGLPVQVIETFDVGADPIRRTTTVETSGDGSFRTYLGPGPSRHVEAVFAGTPLLTRAGAGRVRLEALAGVRMGASTARARIGGSAVVFRGRVMPLGARIPSSGRPVELQFKLRGTEWSEFRTVQTDSHGRFEYAYEFSDDDSRGIRFEFRAFVPRQAGWPYEAGWSRPISVTGV
jgi:hypothetical protein